MRTSDMQNVKQQIGLTNAVETSAETFFKPLDADFRWELAFPELTEDMIQRLRNYGKQESYPAGAVLYTPGDRKIDMFVVVEGVIEIVLPSAEGKAKIFARHGKNNFTGELSLLNSQGAVVE